MSVRSRDYVRERVQEIMEEVKEDPRLAKKYQMLLLDDAKMDWMHKGTETLSGFEMERLCVMLKQALNSLPKLRTMPLVREPHKPLYEVGKRNEGGTSEVAWIRKETSKPEPDSIEQETNRYIPIKNDLPTFTFKSKSIFESSGRILVQSNKPKPPKPVTQKFQSATLDPSYVPFVTKFYIKDCRTMKALVAKQMSLGTEPDAQLTSLRDDYMPNVAGKEDFLLTFKVKYDDVAPLEERKAKVVEEIERKEARRLEAEHQRNLRTNIGSRYRDEFNCSSRPVHRNLQMGNKQPHELLPRELYKGQFDID